MASRQREYGQRLRAPFGKINAEIGRGVVSRDIFGYHEDTSPSTVTEQLAPGDFDPDDLTPESFNPQDKAANQRRFMTWLREQQREGVLSIIHRNDNVYIRRALSDGDRWAIKKLREAGVEVSGGAASPEDFILPDAPMGTATSFNAPMSANGVRRLYERNFNLLQGITSDVSDEINDVLATGFAQGQNPSTIARTMSGRIQSVGKHRATLLARHEVMYAHNELAKDRYREYGVERVKILGSSPCKICRPYVGNIYPINDIPRGGPPYHPQCVGTTSPVV